MPGMKTPPSCPKQAPACPWVRLVWHRKAARNLWPSEHQPEAIKRNWITFWGQFHNTVFMQNQWVRCIPLTRPHQLGKPAPWLRLARSKLDVMGGQTLLFTPRVRLGGSASRQPPWLGAAWEAQSAAISWPRGSFRAWEACWAVLSLPCPAPPTLPYTPFVCSKLQFDAHYQVSKC